MRWPSLSIMLMLTAQTSPHDDQSTDDIARRIERTIVLPPGAKPLEAYGRNYAFSGDDQVRGIYLIPPTLFDERTSCSQGGKPCSSQEVERLTHQNKISRASQASAGQSKWFDDEKNLPFVFDGGCREINIRYRVSKGQIVSASCNGR